MTVLFRHGAPEAAEQAASATLTVGESRAARNIALAGAVLRKFPHTHDLGCPGDHPFELSSNGLVKYPCPRSSTPS